jgi:hypothetical protein
MMPNHLTPDGEFQSEKYDWCPPGFIPLKLTDRKARDLIWLYGERKKKEEPTFSEDLHQALENAGFNPLRG